MGWSFYMRLSEYLAPDITSWGINPCWHSNKFRVLQITYPVLDGKLNKSSQTPVIAGDSNYPNICWRSNTVNYKWSRSFLESIDNFLTQTVEDPRRIMCLLELIQRKGKSCCRCDDWGQPCCRDHEIVHCFRPKS